MRTFLALLLSLLIMVAIFSRISLAEFGRHLSEIHLGLFLLAVFFFVPQVGITAYRWRVMVERTARISLWGATKLTLAANAQNILLPSRMGDLSKAYFVGKEGRVNLKRGTNTVLFEKYVDLTSLGVVALTGIVVTGLWDHASFLGAAFSGGLIAVFPVLYLVDLGPWVGVNFFEKNRLLQKIKYFLLDSQAYLNELKREPRRLGLILGISVFLWFVHLLQFYLIFLAFHSAVSVFQVFRLVPLTILVGLVPVTLAGVGTRDSAMLYFFAPYESAARIVGIGLFASLRYFIPGLLGLPFLNQYIVKERKTG